MESAFDTPDFPPIHPQGAEMDASLSIRGWNLQLNADVADLAELFGAEQAPVAADLIPYAQGRESASEGSCDKDGDWVERVVHLERFLADLPAGSGEADER